MFILKCDFCKPSKIKELAALASMKVYFKPTYPSILPKKGAINNSTVEKLLLGGSMNHIKLIKNKQDHVKALTRIKMLTDENLVPDSKEADELEVLSLLIEHYEQKNFPIEKPEPIEAIQFRMEQLGLLKKDLIPFIGSASKVTEVLNGTRQLSLNMIRRLSDGLDISVEILIGISKPKVDKKTFLKLPQIKITQ